MAGTVLALKLAGASQQQKNKNCSKISQMAGTMLAGKWQVGI
jgi:hypothetical protein